MCFSNCKNENYGECTARIDKHDPELHCFEGFTCKCCGEIYPDTQYMSDQEITGGNICLDCEDEEINAAIDQYTELKIMKWNL